MPSSKEKKSLIGKKTPKKNPICYAISLSARDRPREKWGEGMSKTFEDRGQPRGTGTVSGKKPQGKKEYSAQGKKGKSRGRGTSAKREMEKSVGTNIIEHVKCLS